MYKRVKLNLNIDFALIAVSRDTRCQIDWTLKRLQSIFLTFNLYSNKQIVSRRINGQNEDLLRFGERLFKLTNCLTKSKFNQKNQIDYSWKYCEARIFFHLEGAILFQWQVKFNWQAEQLVFTISQLPSKLLMMNCLNNRKMYKHSLLNLWLNNL